jgi:hypothetical protein
VPLEAVVVSEEPVGEEVVASGAGVVADVAADVPEDVKAELSMTLMSPVRTTSPLQAQIVKAAATAPRRPTRTSGKATGDPPHYGRGPVA